MVDPGDPARDNPDPIPEKMGRDEGGTRCNGFRRFREAVQLHSDVRQLLLDYWMGRSNPNR